jgi:hypothetical protein
VLEAATTVFGSDAVSFALGASPDHPANTTDIAHALHTVEVAAPHVVVLVVGDSLHTCGEWDDRDDLDLPGGQVMKIFLWAKIFVGQMMICFVDSFVGPVFFFLTTIYVLVYFLGHNHVLFF